MVSRILRYISVHHADDWERFKQLGSGAAFNAIRTASTKERLSGGERADLGMILNDSTLPEVVRQAAWIVVDADNRA